MTVYDHDGIAAAFSEGILQIQTEVMEVCIRNTEGTMTAGDKVWHFVQPEPILTVTAAEEDNNGRSIPHLRLTLETASGSETWRLYPDLPFVCTDCHPDARSFSLDARHVQITAVELVDKTDHHDSLVKTDVHTFYRKYTGRGNLFLLEETIRDRALLLVKHAPCPDSAVRRVDCDLYVDGKAVLQGCGYGAAYGIGRPAALFALYRRLYGKFCCQPEVNFIMSNTWGDRSRDAAMREDFVLR
ncbi:MAG: hypothetical protein IJX14_09415, partial [Clostridia bacterium]|nr:hypothetical protein [Clostridia bacterium]